MDPSLTLLLDLFLVLSVSSQIAAAAFARPSQG